MLKVYRAVLFPLWLRFLPKLYINQLGKMFQKYAVCKINLTNIARSSRSHQIFRNGSMEHILLRSIPTSLDVQDLSVRYYSNPGQRPGFFSKVWENIQQDIKKNKEMKESLKKFREERQKLEESEALRSARKKIQAVESGASKGSEVFKETLDTFKGKVQEALEEASKSELGKKAGQIGEEITKSARETGQALGRTGAFQTISQTAEAVKAELDQHGMQGRIYVPPKKLRKRKEIIETDDKHIAPNIEAMGVELHKDSKFYQSWQNFKDNNPYVNKVLDWKIKYEESDNPVIRASRLLTDKVSDIMDGLFQKTQLSETLTEICKLDPNFDKVQFLKDCETDYIPNILEAMLRGDLEILQDWCHQAVYRHLSPPIIQAQKLGYRLDSKILDIDGVDLAMGKVMPEGPVLIITFRCQQINCVRDKDNKVVEGDPEKVQCVTYTWVLCRDPTELNPKAAWRLLDIAAASATMIV